ncbi:hypothetical protein Lepto7376_3508 [[Leptolyngbya] sp. PCC 7376]|uniref:DUF3067 family protein n=1 Tax=[Leptolyngbya] sp. PCC 7376 TaxID=111781 RepID=UPI00029F0E23|nr:DUF3067 family protein [[Leptolyngbya] sp. PCC 7376]AFY39705.1 hypothetical protein Lepto7376_3508 [[Leptolyngbya] sp. PCC 7376]
MTGNELREIIWRKWGRSFDVQLRQIKGEWYLQVMWKYLEQVSFPLSEPEYESHLQAIANYLSEWGVVEQVTVFFEETKEQPRIGKAVSVRLELGARASEWSLD